MSDYNLLCCHYLSINIYFLFKIMQIVASQPPHMQLRMSMPLYERREYVFIANPELSPLFSAIVASRHMISQTIIDMIQWNLCNIVKCANLMMFIDPDSKVSMFVQYDIAHALYIDL